MADIEDYPGLGVLLDSRLHNELPVRNNTSMLRKTYDRRSGPAERAGKRKGTLYKLARKILRSR